MPKGNKAAYGQNYSKKQSFPKQKSLGNATDYHDQKGMKAGSGKYPAQKSDLLGQPKQGKFYGKNTVGQNHPNKTNV